MELNDHIIDEFYICGGGSHKFIEDEIIEGCTVQILKCPECGEYSIGWWRGSEKDKPKDKSIK